MPKVLDERLSLNSFALVSCKNVDARVLGCFVANTLSLKCHISNLPKKISIREICSFLKYIG